MVAVDPVSLNLPTFGVIMLLYIVSAWKDFCEFMVWLLDVHSDCICVGMVFNDAPSCYNHVALVTDKQISMEHW